MAKIFLLAPASSIHSCRWAAGLGQMGHEITLVSQHPLLNEFSNSRDFKFIELPHGPSDLSYFLNAAFLRRLLQVESPDLLHTHFASGYGTLATLSGYHLRILSVWGSDVYGFPDKSPLHRWIIRKNLESADFVLSTSQVMAKRSLEIAQIRKIGVTPFGVDTSIFTPKFESRDPGKFIIGTVKTLSETYGIDLLIKSFDTLLRQAPAGSPELFLRIAGSGPAEKELKELSRRMGLESRVKFLGNIRHSEVPSVLQSLDLFACLSRSESFGVSVLEAGATGLPSIVSRVGGLPEVLKEGEGGWIVPSEDHEEFAKIILNENLFDPQVRFKVGLAAREHVVQNYSWRKSLEIMNEFYREWIK